MRISRVSPILVLALGLAVWLGGVSEAAALGTGFTYQGRLLDDNKAAEGLYDFVFSLYDDPNVTGGNQVGGTVDANDLDVIDGYFAVELDFGEGVFDGNERYLQFAVRPGESEDAGDFITLLPRQRITPAPYALYALSGLPGPQGEEGPPGPAGNSFSGAPYRWAVFSTYGQSDGWYAGDNAAMYGGVSPSQWGDGNATADMMSPDKEVLRTLFTRKGYGGKNALVAAEEWQSYLSTNSKHAAALFRVKNTTANAINWQASVYMTCYSGGDERASIALNGTSVWVNTGNRFATTAPQTVALSIPPDRTSTAIFVAGSSPVSTTRSLLLAFTNNCLQLPAGLEFVDDFDTATGGWEQ